MEAYASACVTSFQLHMVANLPFSLQVEKPMGSFEPAGESRYNMLDTKFQEVALLGNVTVSGPSWAT